ncbi:MAG: hypothetical protein Q9Q13_08165 [Acidobacteriota bacterium]|nr:hypothetical protein [Acidobacteriota bacterium]
MAAAWSPGYPSWKWPWPGCVQEGAPALERDARLRIYGSQARARIESGSLDPGARMATLVLELTTPTVDLEPPPGSPPPQDALLAPEWWDLPPLDETPEEGEAGRPLGATWQNTSEYLAGRISLNLLLPESWDRQGPEAENWTEALETKILAETLQVCADLVTLYPGADLVFTVHLLSGRTDARLRTEVNRSRSPATRAGPMARPAGSARSSPDSAWARPRRWSPPAPWPTGPASPMAATGR